jgi:multidrug efflux system outer membrane protein
LFYVLIETIFGKKSRQPAPTHGDRPSGQRLKDEIAPMLLVVLCVLLLGACSLAPSYKRPPSPVPEAWSSGATVSGTASLGPEAPWRSFLADEGLQRIIETALTNNRDLRLAALNVERTQALYGIARADLLPSVNVMGSGSKGRIPADLTNTGSASTNEQYSVSLGISSWEIDFFGRLRNLRDKALEEFLANDQARRGAQILLVSSVSNACLTLAADRETLPIGRGHPDGPGGGVPHHPEAS